MSIAAKILEELNAKTFYYKGIPVNIFGIPKLKEYYYGSIKSSINNLKQRKLVIRKDNGWILTEAGKEYITERNSYIKSSFASDAPKNLLLIFDIPEEKKVYREWLRNQLRRFDYRMIQRSVWVGPSPLPKEFTSKLREVKIKDCVKTFKLTKGYESF